MKTNKKVRKINSVLSFFIVSNSIEGIDDIVDSTRTVTLFNQVKHASLELIMYEVHRKMRHLNSYCKAGKLRDYAVRVGTKKCLDHTEIIKKLAILFKEEPTTVQQILKWHVKFEKIHPFGDGNGRIGRFLMLVQATKQNVELPDMFFSIEELENNRSTYYALFKN